MVLISTLKGWTMVSEHRSILSYLVASSNGDDNAKLIQQVKCSVCGAIHKPSLSVPDDGKEVCFSCKVREFYSQIAIKGE